ncbi:AraC family transcriptional regulator [Microcoleus sp. herbarium19]|uniref:helix-turn-helix transcriptional regulator n=1 Tax=unclassified Microcoleus TaxID=2642155 RepID=UPI002FD15A00
MTIVLTATELQELYNESCQQTLYSPAHEPFVHIYQVPDAIGSGIEQDIEVFPGVWLWIGRCHWRDDIQIEYPETEHPIQFGFNISGRCVNSDGGQLSQNNTMISGSGIQRELVGTSFPDEIDLGVDVFMSPDRLSTFFPDASGQLPAELNFLVKTNDWQTLIYPKSNRAIQRTVQEIVNCPYRGFEKRLFLQGKVHDLISLQLLSVLRDRGSLPPPPCLKSSTIASIHHAKDLLLTDLENPPSSLELAQQVGVSDRTLQRGFRELFGITVFECLRQQRMIRAEQLLRDGKTTVAEVANRVGYAHLSSFAIAFKQQFGIAPSECVMGKKRLS